MQAPAAHAQDQYIGEIRMVGFNFAPRGWALCNGQLLPISSNTALFSLLGTTYGGDGRTTFALPDLRGRVPAHAGTGVGLSPRRLGERGGVERVLLNTQEIPSHNHFAVGFARGSTSPGSTSSPENSVWAVEAAVGAAPYTESAPNVNMQKNSVQVTVGNTGGSQSHENMQPYEVVNFIIALQGVFPSRP